MSGLGFEFRLALVFGFGFGFGLGKVGQSSCSVFVLSGFGFSSFLFRYLSFTCHLKEKKPERRNPQLLRLEVLKLDQDFALNL